MKIAIVDDEYHAIAGLRKVLEQLDKHFIIYEFRLPSEFLAFLTEQWVDLAILDIEMPEVNGLELAKRVKDLRKETNIIFVTGHSQYALEAYELYVTGFLLKPPTERAMQKALENLRIPLPANSAHIRVQTFGNFEVFVDGTPLSFPRSKSKELLAYLVDRAGTGATAAEIAAVLWEDKPYDRAAQNQTQKIIRVMMQTLKAAGIEEMIIRRRNNLMVDITSFSCDYYDFIKWDTRLYRGEYMSCYSWAEMTSAALSQRMP